MSENSLISLPIEQQCIGGLIRHGGKVFAEIDSFVEATDFKVKLHQVLYQVIKQKLLKNELLDKVIIAHTVTSLNIRFDDEIPSVFDYIESISFGNLPLETCIESFKELVSLRAKRELVETAEKVKQCVLRSGDKSLVEVINEVDKLQNEKISSLYRTQKTEFYNIYGDNLKKVIEDIGDNPPDKSKFLLGPFPTVNRIYGPLLRDSNIVVAAMRSGIGKSSLACFYLTWVSEKYNIPVLSLDFGEMNSFETQLRAAAMLCGGKVPLNTIEDGSWRKNQEWTNLIRQQWPRVEKLKYYYEDISNKKPIEIISLIRRFYYNKVGRGNRFICNYDYLKPFDTTDFNTPEWKQMGHFIQDIKSFITNEVPCPFWSSLQLNRSGITTNKRADQVLDDESTFSISDRVIQQASYAFIGRDKILEELAEEDNKYGNKKLIFLKHRWLGEDYQDALKPVMISKGKYKKNFINIEANSFHFEDRGDLNQMVREMKEQYQLQDSGSDDAALL